MKRILVLVDHKENRRLLTEWLAQRYEVVHGDAHDPLLAPFDLGIVDDIRIDAGAVTIRILPTFVGCPALDMLKDEIIAKISTIASLDGVALPEPWPADIADYVGAARQRGWHRRHAALEWWVVHHPVDE